MKNTLIVLVLLTLTGCSYTPSPVAAVLSDNPKQFMAIITCPVGFKTMANTGFTPTTTYADVKKHYKENFCIKTSDIIPQNNIVLYNYTWK